MATRISEIHTEPPAVWLRLLETTLLTLLLPVAGWWFYPHDPFLWGHGLTWVLITAPLLTGIRYGFAYGFASGLVTAAWLGIEAWRHAGSGGPEISQLLPYVVAMLLVGMLVGEIADVWKRRLAQMAEINRAQATRFEEFVRNYHLLRVSHDQLAERLAANPFSLRDALSQLALRFSELEHDGDLLEQRGGDILNFLALNGRVQQASLYRVRNQCRIDPSPLHCYGGSVALTDNDPMVQACLEQRRLICLKSAMALEPDGADSSLLAVVPLIDVHGHMHALVTISEMPFIDYHRGHLHLLAVLGAQLGDMLKNALHGETAKQNDLSTLSHWVDNARQHDLTSLLVTLTLNRSLAAKQGQEISDFVCAQLRTLDCSWLSAQEDGSQHIHILLPLADTQVEAPYRQRLLQGIESRFGIDLFAEGGKFASQVIDGRLTASALLKRVGKKELQLDAA